MKKLLAISALAFALALPLATHAQGCLDSGCSGDDVCKLVGSTYLCEPNAAATCDPACSSGYTCEFGSCVLNSGGSPTGSYSGFPTPNTSALESYSDAAIDFINSALVPLLIAIAFIVFLWGVAQAYILNPSDESKRSEGHQFILWAVIGFVVIFSLWGLVNLVSDTLGLHGGVAPPTPGAPQSSQSGPTIFGS